jgi:Trk-type K+ transport system membrane component
VHAVDEAFTVLNPVAAFFIAFSAVVNFGYDYTINNAVPWLNPVTTVIFTVFLIIID